jgi:hypothetical protein
VRANQCHRASGHGGSEPARSRLERACERINVTGRPVTAARSLRGADMTEQILRDRLARLTLAQKVRLLTAPTFGPCTPSRPSVDAASSSPTGRPVFGAGPGTSGTRPPMCPPPRRWPPPGTSPAWSVWAGCWPPRPPQGRRRPPRAHRQPAPHPLRRPALRVFQRGPGADRPDRGSLRARPAIRRCRRDRQTLRGQRLRDRAAHRRRGRRRAHPARAVPGAVRTIVGAVASGRSWPPTTASTATG